MTEIKKRRSKWLKLLVVVALVFTAMGTSGCFFTAEGVSFSEGQNMPERKAALLGARDAGFDFDNTLISTSYGSGKSQVLLTGPLVQVLGADGSDHGFGEGYYVKKVEWTQIAMENQGGKWVFTTGTKREPRWFSGSLN